MDGEVTLKKETLQAALQKWEQDARDGKWPVEPDLPVADIAARSADYLWSLLSA